MLRKVNEIIGYMLDTPDGEFGRCDDFLLDDDHCMLSSPVADTLQHG